MDWERITGNTSITAFNPRFSGIYGSMADYVGSIGKRCGVSEVLTELELS